MSEADFYAGIAKRSSEDRVVARIKALERRVDKSVRTPQLTRSAIDDGSVIVTAGGTVVGSVGQQFDGTNGYVALNGPVPPVPSPPTVTTVVAGIKVAWDGTFADPQAGFFSPVHAPQDWQRVDIEVSNDAAFPNFVAPNASNNGSIVSASGGEVTVAWPTSGELLYVRLRARTTAGRRSNPSTVTGPIASGKVGMGDLGFDLGTYVASNSVVYGPTQPDAAGDATRRIGTLWLKELTANKYETWRWTGAQWVFVQDQGITQSLLDAANAQATADLKAKVFSQPSPPTYTGAAGTAIWEDTDDGNKRYLWTDTATTVRRNVIINGSFQVDDTGASTITSWTPFTGGTTGTITRTVVTDSATAVTGTKYLNIVAAGLGGASADRFGIYQDIRCQPGDVVRARASVWMTATDTARPPCLLVNPITSAGAFLTGIFAFGNGASVSKQVIVNTVTVPAGADHVRIYIWRQGSNGTLTLPNADINIDAVMVEINSPAGAPTTYFDGDSTGSTWEGTAHLSPSRQTTSTTNPTLGWVPRELGAGALQTNSVVASDVIATGTVSAALMESLMVLSSTVQSGQSTAQHASMMPDGFRAFTVDPVDKSVGTALQFGTNNNDYLSVMDNSGSPVATISDAGGITGTSMTTDSLTVQGRDYLTTIAGLSEGVVGRFSTWSADIGPIQQPFGLAETVCVLDASRIYLVMWKAVFLSSAVGDVVRFSVYRTQGAEGNFTTLPPRPAVANPTSTLTFDGAWRFYSGAAWQDAQGLVLIEPTANTRYRLGLFCQIDSGVTAGSNITIKNFASDIPIQIAVIDLGPKAGTQVGARTAMGTTDMNGTAWPSPTPTGNYDTGWLQALPLHYSYTGAGAVRTDTTELVHGTDPNGAFGDGKGHYRFTIPNVTGTITRAQFWIYANTTGFSSGSTVKVNLSNDLAVANPAKLAGTDLTVTGVPRGGSKTIDLPSSWYPFLKSKTAISMTLGPSGSTSQTYYTRLHGTSAYLRLWYTQ